MTSEKKLQLAIPALAMFVVGDYLLGLNSIGTTTDPDAPYGLEWNVVPDWRYALSGILAFLAIPLFAVAAVELMRILENEYSLKTSKWYRTFRIGLWTAMFYFALIHIGMCMLPVVFNAGMDATGNEAASIQMAVRVAVSAAVPIFGGFAIVDFCTTIGWIGMVCKGLIPVRKAAIICNPLVMALIGQIVGLIPFPFEGIDSGFESFGWLVMLAVCAARLPKKCIQKRMSVQ